MNKEKYIAALDISSSKITGVVGVLHTGGHADIIAAAQEHQVENVRRGHIHNPEETSRRVARIIDALEQNPQVAPRRITGVFVGLNGMSMRSLTTEVSLQLPDETEINDDILTRLREQALSTAIDNTLEVVDAVDRVYQVGNSSTHHPKGALGNRISATYDLMVCRPSLRRNIQRTVGDKLDLNVNFMVTALATGLVVLPDDEKRLGCMLVDMGAETTTVSIYRGGFLTYLATIPLGGRNITRDLTQLNILEERAEEMKRNSGSALAAETQSSLCLDGLRLSDVGAIIVARVEEIVANVVEQITYAGLTPKDLPAGIICIGGGAKLNGMTELMARLTGLPVRLGRLPAYIRMDTNAIPAYDLIQAVSLLYAGGDLTDEECLEKPRPQELPVTGEAGEEPEQRERKAAKPATQERQKKMPGWMSRLGQMFVPKDEKEEEESDLYE